MTDGREEFAWLWKMPRPGAAFSHRPTWLTPELRPTTDRRARGLWPIGEAESIAAKTGGVVQAVPLLEGLDELEIARARDVNARLVQAYMIRNNIAPSVWPNMDDVTALEAETCGRIVSAADAAEHHKRPPGSSRLIHCIVEPTRAAQYLAWALLGKSGEREIAMRSQLGAPAEDRAMLAEAHAMEMERALRAEGLVA